MSAPRGFPKNPLRDRPDPFRDAEGKNPYAEAGAAAPGASDNRRPPDGNVYAAGAAPALGESTTPVAYETWLPSRGGTLLLMAISGIGLSAIGFFLCGPLNLATLALSLTTIVMAQKDLAAMRAGAMERRRRGMTILAYWLAIFVSLATALLTLWSAYGLYLILSEEL